MRKRVTWMGLAVVAALVIGLVLYQGMQSDAMTYNPNPDVSGKVVGSKPYEELGYNTRIDSMRTLMSYADLVVIGEVISEGVVTTNEWPTIEGAPDMTAELPPVAVTLTDIRIKQTLYGQAPAEIITLLQFGNESFGETKVKKNQQLVLLLAKTNRGESFYKSASWEKGYFEILGDNNVVSFSDEFVVAKYDNRSLDLLTRDILNGAKKK